MQITPSLLNFERVLHTLAASQESPQHTGPPQEVQQGSRQHQEDPRFHLIARDEVSFPCFLEKRLNGIPVETQEEAFSKGKSRGTPGFVPPFQKSPQTLSPIQRKLISLDCTDLHIEDQLTSWWQVGQTCEKARRERVEGKPPNPASTRREA